MRDPFGEEAAANRDAAAGQGVLAEAVETIHALVAVTQASDRGPEIGQVAAGLDRLVAGFALDDAEDDLEHVDNRAARAVPIASS